MDQGMKVPVNVPILGQQKQMQVNLTQVMVEALGMVIMRLDRVIMLMEADLPEDQKTVRLVEQQQTSGDAQD